MGSKGVGQSNPKKSNPRFTADISDSYNQYFTKVGRISDFWGEWQG